MSIFVWLLEKAVLGFIGFWLYETSLILFWAYVVIAGLFLILDVRRQIEISSCLRDVKQEFREGYRKRFILSQLSAERARTTFWFWTLKNVWNGWGNPPKRIQPPCELMDDGPRWVRRKIQRSLWLTEQRLFPFILNGFVPSLAEEVDKFRNVEVLTVLEPGCGSCSLIAKIASICHDRDIPAVFVGVDVEPWAIENGIKWLKKKGIYVVPSLGQLGNKEWSVLLENASIKRTQMVRLIAADFRAAEDQLGDAVHFKLAWLHHFIHHFDCEASEKLVRQVNSLAKKCYVLEEFRSWLPLFLIHLFIWYFPCHLETAVNSILSNRTLAEWKRDFGSAARVKKKGFLAIAQLNSK